ncbi:HpcH/HpaI aldolase/citrate lyase family protein [Qipengyuania atrilutea]|uniref:CoA ester lyase n=1 Tax=Qipengyuania atrilutea TaxID=2744473 RepID=A0A850H4Z3_9SPHN|nr:aldolase/citrate lyase family protein [Actirhodobacter atriluteus]NVD44958.1 CoA ester lyase [Actirhodobacter atriluteus]
MRSWLLVATDNDGELQGAANAGADVVVIDLNRALSPKRQETAREIAQNWLASHQKQVLAQRRFGRWVRISPIDSQQWRADLHSAMSGQADGIVLSDAASPDHIQQLAAEIYEIEQRMGIGHNKTGIVPQLGTSPRAALELAKFADEVHPRVSGYSWDAAALARAIGARRTRAPGGWSSVMNMVRSQVLLAAHARGIDVIETPFRDLRDAKACQIAAASARADGFTGMVALRGAQVSAINQAFAPTAEELREAEEIIALFASNPNLEWQNYKGRRMGQSQLTRARNMLGQS